MISQYQSVLNNKHQVLRSSQHRAHIIRLRNERTQKTQSTLRQHSLLRIPQSLPAEYRMLSWKQLWPSEHSEGFLTFVYSLMSSLAIDQILPLRCLCQCKDRSVCFSLLDGLKTHGRWPHLEMNRQKLSQGWKIFGKKTSWRSSGALFGPDKLPAARLRRALRTGIHARIVFDTSVNHPSLRHSMYIIFNF